MIMKFDSAGDFEASLKANEGVIFADNYGRRWVFDHGKFWFGDLDSNIKEGLNCMHLYGEVIAAEINQ